MQRCMMMLALLAALAVAMPSGNALIEAELAAAARPSGSRLFTAEELVASTPAPDLEADAWGPTENITKTRTFYEYSGYAYSNASAVDTAGNLHTMYYSTAVTPNRIFYRKWTRATTAWGAVDTVSSSLAASTRGGIAVDNRGNVHVAWYRTTTGYYGIWYRKFDADSGYWLAETLLASQYAASPAAPSVACRPGGNNVHVVWTQRDASIAQTKAWHIEYVPGTGWTAVTMVSPDTASYCYRAGVAVDPANNVHVTWSQYGAGSAYYKIWYRARIAGTWGAREQVSPTDMDGYVQDYADIEVTAAGVPHVAWQSNNSAAPTYDRIVYRNRNGGSWGAVDTVSTHNAYYSYYPALSLAADTVHVAWRGYTATTSAYRPHHRRRAGGAWGDDDTLNDWSTVSTATYIHIVADRGEVHAIWYDTWNDSASSYADVWHARRFPDKDNDLATLSIDSIWPFQPLNATVPVFATVRNAGRLAQPPGVRVILNITGPAAYAYADTFLTTDTLR
ncbi:MAG: hypothetical protein R6X13_06435, partial [bacterium]